MNHPQHPFKGVMLAASALLLFAGMDSCTKYLTAHYQVPVVVAMRYLVHLALMLVILAPRHPQALVKIQRKKLVLLRAVSLALLSLFMALALQRMPVAETTAITFTAPLMVALLARPILNERIGIIGWVAVLMGFTGMLLIVRPGSGLDTLGVVFAFLAAVIGTTYQLLSRVLASTERAFAMLFYAALIGSVVYGLAFPFFWENKTPTALEVGLFLFMGAAGGFGHYLFTLAYHHAPASLLAPVTYLQLIWALLLGWLLFNSIPDSTSLLGMSIVAVSGLMIALKSRMIKNKNPV
jgi:drug/metabolite transporter (DMT)-like permease